MTLEEKLENFKKSAIKDAKMQSNSLVQDSEEKIKKSLEEYETKAKADYDSKLKIQTSMIISKNNQDITKDTLKIKQEIEKRRLELVDSLFDDLEKKLIGFKKSEEYKELLVKQIKDIKDYAKDSRITIYIDETDASLVKYLEDNTNESVKISNIRIIGGVKGVIEDKNLLLDYSFINKLDEEKANFSFE